MASHSLAIAKAALAAALMRPDPISVSRSEIAIFHDLLRSLLSRCSPTNIQLCKEWLLRNIIPSTSRVAAFGKYLVSLSESTENPEDVKVSTPGKQKSSSPRRKRLYILYLLNDLLHHTKYHLESSLPHLTLTKGLRSFLSDLFRLVSVYNLGVFNKHYRKIDVLLNTWAETGYYPSSYLLEIREIVEKANSLVLGEANEEPKDPDGSIAVNYSATKDDAPYIMPATHGDISTPYYDLPAGNMMLCIVPNSATPINPQSVKPLHFSASHAKESLVNAVKSFMRETDSALNTKIKDGIFIDVDELGQNTYRDKTTGNITGGESYYGWSREFCSKLQRRYDGREITKRIAGEIDIAEKSPSPRKRRRYSSSESRSRSRSFSPSSNSVGQRSPLRHDMDKRPYSRERSHSRRIKYSRSRSRSGTRSNSYSPPLPPSQTQPSRVQAFPPPPFPTTINHGLPLGPDGLPIPPPPPPNYKGPWPPPPPPLPLGLSNPQPNLSLPGTTYPTIPSNIMSPYTQHFPSSNPHPSHNQRN